VKNATISPLAGIEAAVFHIQNPLTYHLNHFGTVFAVFDLVALSRLSFACSTGVDTVLSSG
jgi:hypothetical protein